MKQSVDKPKVVNILHKNGITYKAIETLVERGPLTTNEIRDVTGCYKPTIGNIIRQSSEIYFMGNTCCGVWYLEYQVQEAKERYYELCKEFEKRKIERRKNQLIVLPINTEMPSVLCAFRDKRDEHTAKDVWRIVGGDYIEVKSHLHSLTKDSVLLVRGDRPKIYRINPKFESMCGDSAREIFGGYLNSDR